MKTYLNLGCGSRYHAYWTNIDFVSHSTEVQAHNLLQGIPFQDESFEVVYHSHVLEHFSKEDGKKFITECYRVLRKQGILRIAVPDLEQINREYLKNLDLALQNDALGQQNYEWIMLEMYDQVVRNGSGGDMAAYIFQANIPNEDYVFARIGEEGRNIRKQYLLSKEKTKYDNTVSEPSMYQESKNWKEYIKDIFRPVKNILKNYLFAYEINHYEQQKEWIETQKQYIEIGKFRLGGEIHQWMYDRYSLLSLLKEIGFVNIEVKTAFESKISNWNVYELESKDGIIFKPDSLFMEATK